MTSILSSGAHRSPAASSMPASPNALPTQTVPMGGLMYRIVS